MAKRKRKSGAAGRAAVALSAQGRKTGAGERRPVTLSQCMIVKNEERNIEKALSWGKGIVCEQIVVDTGSTDRTVEIAERMGAKVFHFEWVNDFAAAKNHAIAQATGDWIAFLDADEYIPEEEVGLVMPLLDLIEADPKTKKQYMAVNCPWVQLDENGNPKGILGQERIFRNLPAVHYLGRIHEHLSLEKKDVVHTKDFRIMHTGYTGESFILTGKASRNIDLLRAELEDNPKNMTVKAYLAESILAEIATELQKAGSEEEAGAAKARLGEVNRLYEEVLKSKAEIPEMLKTNAYDYFLEQYSNTAEIDPDMDKLCEKALREFPKDHRFMCYKAMIHNKRGEYREAYNYLKRCESSLGEGTGKNSMLTTKITALFSMQMIFAAQGLGDLKAVTEYAAILLMMNKTDMNMLAPYIAALTRVYPSTEDALDELARIYDMSSKSDLLLIARAAKNCGAINIARRIIDVAAYLGNDN